MKLCKISLSDKGARAEVGQKKQNKAQTRKILKAKRAKGGKQTSLNGGQATPFFQVHYSAIK